MSNDKHEIGFDDIIPEAETVDAWLIEIDGKRHWMPKSQCDLDEKRKTIEAPEWLLEKKDLL